MTDLQLAQATTPAAVEEREGWLAERKLDGVRAVAVDGRLKTRSGNDVTASFPEIDPPDVHVLDGEIITTDFTFETALRRVQTEDRFTVELLADQYPARLVVFDVLEVNGGDVTDQPLTERKELIGPSIPSESGLIEISTSDDPAALWDEAQAKEWEGIMLKDPDAEYRRERTDRWLKIKDWEEETFPILDHEHTDDGGFVVYVDVGTDEPQKVAVNGQADQADVQEGAEQAEVQFLERSDNDRLRKPSFRGVA